MSNELKPCPKCKSDNIHHSDVMQDKPHKTWWQASCDNCGFEGSKFPFDVEADGEFQAERDAVSEWNAFERPVAPAPVPTSGAVEVARDIWNRTDDVSKAEFIQQAAPIIQQAMEEYAHSELDVEIEEGIKFKWGPGRNFKAWLATQPPAADGKLAEYRQVLDWLVADIMNTAKDQKIKGAELYQNPCYGIGLHAWKKATELLGLAQPASGGGE